MNYKILGSSNISISEIGFGCMSLKGDTEANRNILSKAFDEGINYFDTADIYEAGTNEILVGKAFKNIRNKVIIATKVGNIQKPGIKGFEWNAGKAHIISAIEGSLKRLQTDYIDLYQLHGGMIEDNIDETIEAFELLKTQGKIRAYGISSIRPNVIREYVKKSNIASVMMQYSLLDRRPEEECLHLLLQHNISVLARGSVAQGLLIDKSPKDYLQHTDIEVKKAAAAVSIISNNQRSVTQTALRFALQNPAVTSAVVGVRTEQQLLEAVQTSASPALAEDEINYLKNTVPAKVYEQHR